MDREYTAWTTHPRPQLKRELYKILNGEWNVNGHKIRVPFPPESELSGYGGELGDEYLYERTFSIPESFHLDRILLHIGAADQIAQVRVNGRDVGCHEGGYLPFSFDITELVKREDENVLEVLVRDELSKDYPYGKQSRHPKGMWYTPVSGIWQTVWLENVPDTYIRNITIKPALDSVELRVTGNKKVSGFTVELALPDKKILKKEVSGEKMEIAIPNPLNWTPDNPYLYNITITAGQDRVKSYFALRTIHI